MSKLTAQLFISFVLLNLGLIFLPPVFAARTVTIESYKQTFINDEEGEVKVAIADFNDGESIFVKGAFSKPDSSNYFGYTKKGESWVKNSTTSSNQLLVKVGEWDGRLIVKPDLSDTGFVGGRDYNFKIGFYYYTTGGNLSSVNWSDTKSVNISFVPSVTSAPTITPVPTSIPTSSSTNTPVPAATSKPQSPSAIKESVTPPKISPTITSQLTPTSMTGVTKENEGTPKVLGESVKKTNTVPVFVLFLLGAGVVCFGGASYLAYKQIARKRKEMT